MRELAIQAATYLEDGLGYNQHADAIRQLLQQRAELLEALKKIAAIPNNDFGSDWEEIEEARTISMMAIQKAYE